MCVYGKKSLAAEKSSAAPRKGSHLSKRNDGILNMSKAVVCVLSFRILLLETLAFGNLEAGRHH
jgi:hypothetical protein